MQTSRSWDFMFSKYVYCNCIGIAWFPFWNVTHVGATARSRRVGWVPLLGIYMQHIDITHWYSPWKEPGYEDQITDRLIRSQPQSYCIGTVTVSNAHVEANLLLCCGKLIGDKGNAWLQTHNASVEGFTSIIIKFVPLVMVVCDWTFSLDKRFHWDLQGHYSPSGSTHCVGNVKFPTCWGGVTRYVSATPPCILSLTDSSQHGTKIWICTGMLVNFLIWNRDCRVTSRNAKSGTGLVSV